MRLAEWRKHKGITQAQLASELGVTQPLISAFERARNPSIPGPAVMIELYQLTRGYVQPNDFYDLPDLRPQADAA